MVEEVCLQGWNKATLLIPFMHLSKTCSSTFCNPLWFHRKANTHSRVAPTEPAFTTETLIGFYHTYMNLISLLSIIYLMSTIFLSVKYSNPHNDKWEKCMHTSTFFYHSNNAMHGVICLAHTCCLLWSRVISRQSSDNYSQSECRTG